MAGKHRSPDQPLADRMVGFVAEFAGWVALIVVLAALTWPTVA